MLDKKNILGIDITNASKKDILEYIIKGLGKEDKKWYIVTINPEILMLAYKNNHYQKVLNNAELALPDGIGIVIASKILGKPIKERITGVDLLENICKEISEKPITVGFLGGKGGVAEATAECLRRKYPGLKVVFVGEEWSGDSFARQPRVSDDARLQNSEDHLLNSASLSKSRHQTEVQPTFSSSESGLPRASNLAIEQFNNETIDILFVAFGAPKQEIWIAENLNKIPVEVAMGVGGAFDYISGNVPRAPLLIRLIGFEWLFRLIVQPWRWKRQLALLKFAFLVLKEKFSPRNTA